MALYIHCGFARVAIKNLIKEHAEANGHHNLGYDIWKYNDQFGEFPGMKLDGNPDYVLKKCKEMNATFSQKWHPQENVHSYIATFSPEKWSKLPTSQRTATLLVEAKTWTADEQINWTQLAGRYEVTGPNRGQIVKEFLELEGIQAAMTKRQIIRRAKLRLPGGEVTYPTHMTIAAQKRTLLQKVRRETYSWVN